LSKTFKIYIFIFCVGIIAVAWVANRWQDTVDRRYDAAKVEPKKLTKRTPDAYDSEYDRSGRIAAIRVYPALKNTAEVAQPIFWAKGNLITVEKDEWGSAALKYSRRDISRDLLHSMIEAIQALPSESTEPTDLVITRTLAAGTEEKNFIGKAHFRTMLESWMSDRKKRPFTLQSLVLFGEETQLQPVEAKWPVRVISLRKLVKSKRMTIRKKSHIERLQSILFEAKNYPLEEKVIRVSALARVDR
jgi:hypothetical protein